MANCEECGDLVSMPFECNRCGGSYCSSHRLPEKHYCGLNTEPSAPSPDVNPDGSIKRETVSTTAEENDQSNLELIAGLLILAVLAPFMLIRRVSAMLLSIWPILILGAGVLLLVGGFVGTGVAPIDDAGEFAVEQGSGLVPNTSDTFQSPPERFNNSEVEVLFIQKLNEERESQGLNSVERWKPLTKMGDSHAANMAKHEYIGHEQPDGTTIEDRYRERGLLPECRLSAGGNRYYEGAENAAGSDVSTDVTHPGNDKIYDIDTEEELAQFLMDSWMTSSGHRRVMLLESASRVGLGLNITESGRVYAALEFC